MLKSPIIFLHQNINQGNIGYCAYITSGKLLSQLGKQQKNAKLKLENKCNKPYKNIKMKKTRISAITFIKI